MNTLVIHSRIPAAFASKLIETATKIEMEPEEVQLSTSGGGEQTKEQEKEVESEESFDSDEIDDEFLSNYCETAEIPHPMTVSKELFYTDEMVARNYARLSKQDQERFNQMKELAEAIKKEMGDYSLIEDMMARVVGERFGGMSKEDVKAIMGKEGEGAERGKHLKQEGSRLVIKSEPGVETEKIVLSAIVPSEEPALLPYCVKENEEQSDCETIGSDADIEEINKIEVRDILKELAELRQKEAECFDRLAQAVPDMQDNEVVILAERVKGSELPQCAHQMSQRIDNPRDFHAALAVGERLYSSYKYNQAGMPPTSTPDLCTYFDVGKTKMYELLRGGKYKYTTKEEGEVEKKPLKRIKLERIEEAPQEKIKKTKATPTT